MCRKQNHNLSSSYIVSFRKDITVQLVCIHQKKIL
uniref:Uncharacterized protein n=1 Tax=Rhizophora mucronata TaxID=61149 RepID=A0A2P2PCM5_RHIMU